VSLLAATVIISHRWGTGSLRDDYGLRFRAFDLLGVPIGVASQAVLIPAIYWVLRVSPDDVSSQARTLTDRAAAARGRSPGAHGRRRAPIIEELFFRRLLMRAIQAR
jgi:hypothetical protein